MATRKELLLSREEIFLIQFAQKYYHCDMTTTMRILMRSAIIELIARAKRDGVPALNADMIRLIEGGGLM
jgi:hypothetical protein